MTYDVIIIGSGVTGAGIARELSKYKLKIAVLDKASELPSGASRANSSMIHGGFDDKPGTMKAKFCVPGNKLWHKLKDELDVHLNECGSYVCAFDDKETKHLEELLVDISDATKEKELLENEIKKLKMNKSTDRKSVV